MVSNYFYLLRVGLLNSFYGRRPGNSSAKVSLSPNSISCVPNCQSYAHTNHQYLHVRELIDSIQQITNIYFFFYFRYLARVTFISTLLLYVCLKFFIAVSFGVRKRKHHQNRQKSPNKPIIITRRIQKIENSNSQLL